jgi:DNA-binding transcriptional ArsR family regulator
MQTTQETIALVRARFFQALAEPSRLAILDALRAGERTAGEVAALVGLSPSNASRHLACLRASGLVETRQVWRHVHYRLAGEHIAHLLREADLVLEVVAGRFATCADHRRDGC